jgi:arsenite methyltransferase
LQRSSTLILPPAARADYGIDAPGIILQLGLSGFGCLLIGSMGPPVLSLGPVDIDIDSLLLVSLLLFATAGLMLLYALRGKLNQRDRMLSLHAWRGTERVLDVGTGRGLLLVGAARHLTSGHGVGLDVWSRYDLSGNSIEGAERNLRAEGVSSCCTLVTESAAQMSFTDASFDVVLSNMCLHHIRGAASRTRACHEIARVMKPGGIAIISDYRGIARYATLFEQCGLTVERHRRSWSSTFPPLAIVVARKPEAIASR